MKCKLSGLLLAVLLVSLVFNAKSQTYECKIRVLVMYTQNVVNEESDIKEIILNSIDNTNDALEKSEIDYRVELAYAGLTDIIEHGLTDPVSLSEDKITFKNDNDINDLRTEYAADICILLTDWDGGGDCNNRGGSGEAIGLNTSSSDSFAVVHYDCATAPSYTFAHEIGHLIGCAHDNDPNPYQTYGKGFIDPGEDWRTMMGTYESCEECPRIPYYSNPDVYYLSDQTGNSTIADCARIWEEESEDFLGITSLKRIMMFQIMI